MYRKRWEIGQGYHWALMEVSYWLLTRKSLTLNDLEGQYCNRNCIGCSAFSIARRFYREKNLRNLSLILALVFYDCSCLCRLARRLRVTARDVCYTSVNCSFREQRLVNIACMKLCHFWEIAFSLWLEVGHGTSDVGGIRSAFPSVAGFLVYLRLQMSL